MDSKTLDEFARAIKKTKIKSCLIMREDSLVFEYYKNRKIEINPQKSIRALKAFYPYLLALHLIRNT